MTRTFKHIPTIFIAIVILLVSCSDSEEKVIPRNKLSRIYAEMLMTDQWISSSANYRSLADTTLIYEPILNEYGYDSEDYRHTVDVYLEDPERFAKILRTTSEMLDARYKELDVQKKAMEAAEKRAKRRERFRTSFNAENYFPYMHNEPYVKYYDSLAVEVDTLTRAYKIIAVEIYDTLYDRIEMIIRVDSLAVADSISCKDTLAVEVEQVDKVDTVAFKELQISGEDVKLFDERKEK